MQVFLKRTGTDERGIALVIAILVLALLTIIGIAATTTSSIELQISGSKRTIEADFYSTEGALVRTLESPGSWLTSAFLSSDETSASYTGSVDTNTDGSNDALVEIRYIGNSGTSVTGLSDAANDIPNQPHTGPPPTGSGYSMKHFEAHRYGITSTSTDGNSQLQTGVWKVFNRFD